MLSSKKKVEIWYLSAQRLIMLNTLYLYQVREHISKSFRVTEWTPFVMDRQLGEKQCHLAEMGEDNDKQEQTDFLLHNTTDQLKPLVQWLLRIL